MTVAQLDSLVTLLRSRPGPENPEVGEVRARFEKMADYLGGAPDAKCEKVDAGAVLCRLYYTQEATLEEAAELVEDAFRISSSKPDERELILEVVG